jgi:hypothetical protein
VRAQYEWKRWQWQQEKDKLKKNYFQFFTTGTTNWFRFSYGWLFNGQSKLIKDDDTEQIKALQSESPSAEQRWKHL